MKETDRPADRGGRPRWWSNNERYKARLDLPAYEPPRFDDGAYTHDVVAALEDEYGCSIRFVGLNVGHLDDWDVRVDGVPEFAVGRYRTERGNVIYRMSSDDFEDRVRAVLDPRMHD